MTNTVYLFGSTPGYDVGVIFKVTKIPSYIKGGITPSTGLKIRTTEDLQNSRVKAYKYII
jgi:hypothetical protein